MAITRHVGNIQTRQTQGSWKAMNLQVQLNEGHEQEKPLKTNMHKSLMVDNYCFDHYPCVNKVSMD